MLDPVLDTGEASGGGGKWLHGLCVSRDAQFVLIGNEKNHLVNGILMLVLSPVVMGCAQTASKGPITIGSKIDTEGGLLAQMIIQMLQSEGFRPLIVTVRYYAARS
jgi:hypothetical protein